MFLQSLFRAEKEYSKSKKLLYCRTFLNKTSLSFSRRVGNGYPPEGEESPPTTKDHSLRCEILKRMATI
jgi:hypothetical protein